MMSSQNLRKISWVGSTKLDLKKFPTKVQREVGFNLFQIQEGKTPKNAKPLKGIGSGVLELVSRYNSDTYRTVYALKLGDSIYVLHAFQKKSKTGIKTPKPDIDLIKSRINIVKSEIQRQHREK